MVVIDGWCDGSDGCWELVAVAVVIVGADGVVDEIVVAVVVNGVVDRCGDVGLVNDSIN